MSHRFVFTVSVEVERDSGPFATRDELEEQLVAALEGADPGSLSGDNGGEYSVGSWDVSPVGPEPRRRKAKAAMTRSPVWSPDPRP